VYGGRIGRLDTTTGALTELKTRGNPYGLALDRDSHVWFCQLSGDRLGRVDAKTGAVTEVDLEAGSRPRRVATAPDGSLWVTYNGNGKLVRFDPAPRTVVKEYRLPAGPDGGPYAVSVDGGGIVWANEIKTDTVVRLDPKTDALRVIKLPSARVGIRKMIVDASGRLWYMGSHNGRLGVIE
jgi:virginiamycin B lyase